MKIAASIRGASKEYKAGDKIITALQLKTFDFMNIESRFNEKRAELVYKQIELIYNSWTLSSFTDSLR